MKILYTIIFFFVTFIFEFCKEPPQPEEQETSNKLHDLITGHPSTHKELYDLSVPWDKRVYNLDEVHRDYATKMNELEGFSQKPVPNKKFNEIKKSISKIASREPARLKNLKNESIYGIYFCSKLGSTGLTGFIRDGSSSPGGFIILDGDKIHKKANEWISEKEESVFQESKKSKVRIRIANKKNNTFENALEYILLHEMGHIVAQKCEILPDQGSKNRDFSKYEFSREDWIDAESSKHDKNFPLRKFIQFYDEDSDFFLGNDGIAIYTQLLKTPFPTLYSSLNPDEHFADSFVSYVHIFIYKYPWELEINTPKLSLTMANGLNEPRSRREKSQIEKILNDCSGQP